MTLKLSSLVKSTDLYKEAFTHKSLSTDKNFERLEFLGDSLLGASITELLYKSYPSHKEGDLSRWKSALISQETLSEICDELNLTDYLLCKESEAKSLKSNTRIKASLVESFLGAYYLHQGNSDLAMFIESLYSKKIEEASLIFSQQDPKTIFQELAQKEYKITPTYKILSQMGPSHAPSFKVGVLLNDEVFECGEGSSMKEAQMLAAKKAIIKMEKI